MSNVMDERMDIQCLGPVRRLGELLHPQDADHRLVQVPEVPAIVDNQYVEVLNAVVGHMGIPDGGISEAAE